MKLTIQAYEQALTESIQNNQLTIVSTPTSSGKTMFVPRLSSMLSKHQTYCLVPRVVMAKHGIHSYKSIWNEDAGYITGKGDTSNLEYVDVVFSTEGSFVARNLIKNLPSGAVLCVDEVHEQFASTEAILYVVKGMMERGVKVVLMSATLDIEKYKTFYTKDNYKVGIVEMKQKERKFQLSFEITETPYKSIFEKVSSGSRALIGVSGKADIEKVQEEFERMGIKEPIFGLHGEMEQEDLDFALKYTQPAVYIATNMLQSGVTIENLDCGTFSGKGKRVMSKNGVPTLVEYDLSQDEMNQWFGRLGRMCEGTVFWNKDQSSNFIKRPKHTTPEILRIPLPETILLFAGLGLNIESIDLLNNPKPKEVNNAYNRLQTLKLLDTNKKLTPLGKEVKNLQQGLQAGIVIVRGKERGIENLSRKVAALIRHSHPFQNADMYRLMRTLNISRPEKNSDYLVWVKIIEYFQRKYGSKLNESTGLLLKQECESYAKNDRGGIYRRVLRTLIKEFERIDEMYSDVLKETDQPEVLVSVLKEAFLDQVVNLSNMTDLQGKETSKGRTSVVEFGNKKFMCGFVVEIEREYDTIRFIDGVTVF